MTSSKSSVKSNTACQSSPFYTSAGREENLHTYI